MQETGQGLILVAGHVLKCQVNLLFDNGNATYHYQ